MIQKTITLICLCSTFVVGNGVDAGVAKEIMERIHQVSRHKLADTPAYYVYDPFAYVLPKPKPKVHKTVQTGEMTIPRLGGIINRKDPFTGKRVKSAALDGEWLSEGEYIRSYRLIHIGTKSVILQQRMKTYTLMLGNNLNIITMSRQD